MGCHFLLQCMKVKSERRSCPTLCNPIDCSLPGSSVHGIFQARVLEWGAIAFSIIIGYWNAVSSAVLVTRHGVPGDRDISRVLRGHRRGALKSAGASLTGSHRGSPLSITILSSQEGAGLGSLLAAFGFLIPSSLGRMTRRATKARKGRPAPSSGTLCRGHCGCPAGMSRQGV